nr:LINE-type retrotransposon LIb DNA [Ipomoea batatas]
MTTRVSFAYIRPNLLAKEVFWDDCKDYAIGNSGPWIMMGDFNDIVNDSEEWGSSAVNMSCCTRFVNNFNDCGLLDMGTMGVRYSWFRQEGGQTKLRRKLDRVFWNIETQANFLEAKAAILPRTHSDILLSS